MMLVLGFKKMMGSFGVSLLISCACFLYVRARQMIFPMGNSGGDDPW